ncbi:hypothetical protein [Nonomuraea bangladeshensis]|uniref:hypothetical protein n=1 Tax=Nonomuraea bangladeshensis TaxID=404385 RepID=UPI003C2DEF4E
MALAIPILALIGLMLMQVLEETLLDSSAPASGPRTPEGVSPGTGSPAPADVERPGSPASTPSTPSTAGTESTPHAPRRRPQHRAAHRLPIPRPRRPERRALHPVLPRPTDPVPAASVPADSTTADSDAVDAVPAVPVPVAAESGA